MPQRSSRESLDPQKRPIRVLALLDALARAAVDPVPGSVLHELAYLANVLAPVFDLMPLSASLLKRRGGPYYPELQETLDMLVGRRIVDVTSIRYLRDSDDLPYQLDAHYRLNSHHAPSALERYRQVYATTGEPLFIDELASAYSMLSDDLLGKAALHDARYSDGDVDNNDVIDFGHWTETAKSNFSRNAALTFRRGERLDPAERLYMYMAHVQRRASGA